MASFPRRVNNNPPDMFRQILAATIIRNLNDFSLLTRHARTITDIPNGDRRLPSFKKNVPGQ